jgi:hypothetical protein
MEDLRLYIYSKLEELDLSVLKNQWLIELNENNALKLGYENLEWKKLHVWNLFPSFNGSIDTKYLKISLRRMHDKLLWMKNYHLITKEMIKFVTRIYDIGAVLVLKYVNNEVVMKLASAIFGGRALTTKPISNPIVRYASIMIGHKI